MWKQNEPDEPGKLCSGMQSDGLWEDMSCEQSSPFPCEKGEQYSKVLRSIIFLVLKHHYLFSKAKIYILSYFT